MAENIRNIGLFMIVAQTVVHFAAGKQYEKYIKAITGVIVLFLFLAPYVDADGQKAYDWQAELARIEERAAAEYEDLSESVYPAADAVLGRLGGPIRERLNAAVADDSCRVTDVEVVWDTADGTPVLDRVKIAISCGGAETAQNTEDIAQNTKDIAQNTKDAAQNTKDAAQNAGNAIADTEGSAGSAEDAAADKEDGLIRIGQITVQGDGGQAAAGAEKPARMQQRELEEYRRLFAQVLGIAADQVEVTEDGIR